jgi:hypothetical protein
VFRQSQPRGEGFVPVGRHSPTFPWTAGPRSLTLPENAVADRQKEPRVVLLFVGATIALYTALSLGFVWL